MAENARDAFNSALSLFSSLYQDMAPTDLPEGLSPDNQDVFYLPGSVSTRPAVQHLLANPIGGNPDIISVDEYPTPSGDVYTFFLDSVGVLRYRRLDGTVATVGTINAIGAQFKSVSAFDKQWFAWFGTSLSSLFSQNPFVGVDVPRYFDGVNVWRVTQDAPGLPPTFSNLQTSAIALTQSSSSGSPLVVTGIRSTGSQSRFVPPDDYIQFWTTLLVTCSTAVPTTWLGQTVALSGLPLDNVTSKITLVSGNNFTISLYSDSSVTLSGLAGSATLTGNYLRRSANIVTAYVGVVKPPNFTAGFYAQIGNSSGAAINGPNWTITAITRDSNGLVTVTISTQLTNLPSGTKLYINATDTTDFPPGLQTVYQVLSASGGTTVFTISNPTWGTSGVTTSAGGTVYQVWSGIFQIQSVALDVTNGWFITYFQLGPDIALSSTGGTGQAQLQSQVTPGIRNAVLIFESLNGAQTAPSISVQVSVTGGSSLLLAQQILIGPSGTARRIIAFTPANGSSYFYTAPAIVPSVNGLAPVLSIGTIINDNSTTSAVLDFSDAQLTSSNGATQIDIQGNNLFNQVVLGPCLGCIEYQGRMAWWGEINNLKNLDNMGFDGGYIAPTGFCNTAGTTVTYISGTPFPTFAAGAKMNINGGIYTILSIPFSGSLILTTSAGTQSGAAFTIFSPANQGPPGWALPLSGYPVLVPGFTPGGFALQFLPAGGTPDSVISQPAAFDELGAPRFLPGRNYMFRFLGQNQGNQVLGVFTLELYSPTFGQQAAAEVPLTVFPTAAPGWMTASFVSPMPQTLPSDTLFRLSTSGMPFGAKPTIDELSIIDVAQPVLAQQMRLSYFDNPFGYDAITGLVGYSGSDSLVGAFEQRGNLYPLTDKRRLITKNTGNAEPADWPIEEDEADCGLASPCAIDSTAGVAIWVGDQGVQIFSGGNAKKLSQELQPTFDSANWTQRLKIWLAADHVQRLAYIGLPIGGNTKPNLILPVSYRSVDSAYNVPDPQHVSFSGKLIATDNCRKWTRWNLPMQCGAMARIDATLTPKMVFGGASFGSLYTLDLVNYPPLNPAAGSWNFTDADYGAIPGYYVTCFFFNHELEQSAPGLGLHRKLFDYLALYVTGVGSITITPLVNRMGNAWTPLTPVTLSLALNHDLEWRPNVLGERVAYKISALAFNLQHLVVTAREDRIFPVRGAIL